jgi:hypothetical protein
LGRADGDALSGHDRVAICPDPKPTQIRSEIPSPSSPKFSLPFSPTAGPPPLLPSHQPPAISLFVSRRQQQTAAKLLYLLCSRSYPCCATAHGPAWTPCSRPVAQLHFFLEPTNNIIAGALVDAPHDRARGSAPRSSRPLAPSTLAAARARPTYSTGTRHQLPSPGRVPIVARAAPQQRPTVQHLAALSPAPGEPLVSNGASSPAASRSPCRSPTTSGARCPFAPLRPSGFISSS